MKTELFQQAIDKWGVESQIEMIHEECLELALSLQKSRRVGGRPLVDRYDEIIDEIADVTIMMHQAKIIFSNEKIQERIDFKLKRLEERLNKK